MGFYLPTTSASEYIIAGSISLGRIQVTTAAADKTIGTVVLPAALFGTIKAAYLDVTMEIVNTAAALNYVESEQNIEATDGASPINAIVLGAQSLYGSTDAYPRTVTIRGKVDISTIAVAGATITVIWRGADMHANGYDISKMQPSIRFVTG